MDTGQLTGLLLISNIDLRGGIISDQNGRKTRFNRFLGEQLGGLLCQSITDLLRERFSIN
jgi:hypothetical protein